MSPFNVDPQDEGKDNICLIVSQNFSALKICYFPFEWRAVLHPHKRVTIVVLYIFVFKSVIFVFHMTSSSVLHPEICFNTKHWDKRHVGKCKILFICGVDSILFSSRLHVFYLLYLSLNQRTSTKKLCFHSRN